MKGQGRAVKGQGMDKSINQVTELDDDWGYGHVYDDWKIHEILVKVAIPLSNDATREDAIEIVQEALDNVGLDIRMKVQA